MCPTSWSLAFVSISTALSSSNSPTTSPWRTCVVASTSHLASRPPASAKAWCAPCLRPSDSLAKAWELPNDWKGPRREARRSPSNHGDPCWTPCAWRARRSGFGWRLPGRQPHVEELAREPGHVPHPHSRCKPARRARALPSPTRERLDAGESSCAPAPGGVGRGYRQRGRQPPCRTHSGSGGDGRAGRQPGDDRYPSARRRTMTNPELGTIETAPRKANLTMSLVLRNLSFTIVVPGLGGVYVPWLILTQHGGSPRPVAWYDLAVVAGGLVLYFSCLWFFGAVGRGTPGVWDAPRTVGTVGPDRWVRNPIYIGALLIVFGEAWLFVSVDLVLYAAALAVAFHVLVIGYEEPRLRGRFGTNYEAYRHSVLRWIPRPPKTS